VTNNVNIPSFDALMNPLLTALKDLGGSATIAEIVDQTAQVAQLTEEQLQVPHGRGNRTEVEYKLAWTRTYLKAYGLLENSSRGVWSLTAEGKKVQQVSPRDVVALMHRRPRPADEREEGEIEDLQESDEGWREQLLEVFLLYLRMPLSV
jgi:restriction system protein